jgi:hypothetical protein
MAVGNITVTTAANFIPEIWSKDAKIATEANLVFAKRVNRQFEADMAIGDTLHIPNLSNLSVRAKSAETDVTFETLTEGKTDVLIDKYYYAAVKIEDIVEVQENQDLRARYTDKIGYALAKQIDTDLGARYADISQTVGSQGTAVSLTNVLRAIQYLDDADVPGGDRSWVIRPVTMASLFDVNEFTLASDLGDLGLRSPFVTGTLAKGTEATNTVKGYLGQILGVEVFVSTNVASSGTSPITYHNLLFHRDAFILVSQRDIRVQSDYNIRSLATEVVGDTIYGVKTWRADFAVDYLT